MEVYQIVTLAATIVIPCAGAAFLYAADRDHKKQCDRQRARHRDRQLRRYK